MKIKRRSTKTDGIVTSGPSKIVFLIIVLGAAMVIVPVFDHVVVADRVMLPETVMVPVDAIVQVEPVVVKLKQGLVVPATTVIVGEPESTLIITSSAAVGTDAPPAPPEVSDQFVVVVASQLPLPPRQYLVAI